MFIQITKVHKKNHRGFPRKLLSIVLNTCVHFPLNSIAFHLKYSQNTYLLDQPFCTEYSVLVLSTLLAAIHTLLLNALIFFLLRDVPKTVLEMITPTLFSINVHVKCSTCAEYVSIILPVICIKNALTFIIKKYNKINTIILLTVICANIFIIVDIVNINKCSFISLHRFVRLVIINCNVIILSS